MPICNICFGSEFVDFNGRTAAQCLSCKSLERHRLIRETLENIGYLNKNDCFGMKRLLHLAPESMTYNYLYPIFGSGYYAADMNPVKYGHCKALKLLLPDGFNIFPKEYFDLILHNHVLEHIPGSYKDHLKCFTDILKPDGHMIFTIPFFNYSGMTIEGGENLPSDQDRLRVHGQSDHYKTFGKDFMLFFEELNGSFSEAIIPYSVRERISATKDKVFIFSKKTLL